MLDVVWIAFAFGLGLVARQLGLPPLVGYLAAGFILHGFGQEANQTIGLFAQLGVTLLLFTIGLKLKLGSLAQPQIWAVAGIHGVTVVLLLVPALLALGALGLPYLADLDWASATILAFALSFSSTVFAVKALEEKGELGSYYGTIVIGILIMQDLEAVLFLGVSAGKVPTIWALLLLLLIPARPLIFRLLERTGHGELLVLFGLALALGGYHLFELVGVKGDLGALILGILIAPHLKAKELAKTLLSFKDLFLVGFFLSIGLAGAPTPPMVGIALLLVAAVPAKLWIFHRLLLLFRLRARTSLLTSLTLANDSEFGLIVAAIGVANNWIGGEWLIILAVAVSVSFVLAAPLTAKSHEIYERLSPRLHRMESARRIPAEAEIDPGDADVLIIGMGRVGTGAYDTLAGQKGRRPVGIDSDPDMVRFHQGAGRNVIQGSATDPDFWHRLQRRRGSVRLVLLSMPKVSENVFAAKHLKSEGFDGIIGAIAKFSDDEPVLRDAGVDMVFNLYAEAGAGFAQHVCTGVISSSATTPA
ncbi:MAG: cation:proton antiporter family protein [Chromatiaceae bacterium]